MAVVSHFNPQRSAWHRIVLVMLGFWLSSSLIIDLLVMPGLYGTGMMNQASFASAGYVLFGMFNRVEILCAALVLTGVLILRQGRDPFAVVASGSRSRWALEIAGMLVAIALLYTYVLTPTMSAIGMQLDYWQTATAMPTAMVPLHGLYWLLEVVKLVTGGLLLQLCYSDTGEVA